MGAVFLAGDAGQEHPPSGGQRSNTGVQDAHNLSWKLAAVSGGADPGLLDGYQAERRFFEKAKKSATRVFRTGSRSTQLDIDYQESDLSVDQRSDAPRRKDGWGLRPGDRIPDGCLTDGRRLFDLLRGPRWTLLTVSIQTAEQLITEPAVGGQSAEHRLPLETVPSELLPARIVLIRPDGYIGLLADDPAVVWHYLARYAIMCRGRSAG